MCSRFKISAASRDIRARFRLLFDPPLKRRDEIRPTNEILTISAGGDQVTLSPWGFPAPWDGKPLINARAETLAEKKTFLPHLHRRCLVPATGYYEWRNTGRTKVKNLIALKDQPIFAFAGLLNDTGEATIITTKPSEAIAHIHGRMPVILNPEDEAAWINPQHPFDRVKSLLQPYQADPFQVNEEIPKNHQPDLFAQ